MLRGRIAAPVLNNSRASALTVQRHFKPTGRDSYDNYGAGLWLCFGVGGVVLYKTHDNYFVRTRVPRGSGPAPKITPGGGESHAH